MSKLINILKKCGDFVKKNKEFSIVTAAWTLTAVADAYLTVQGTNMGIIREGNPIGEFLVNNLGPTAGVIAQKSLGVGAIGLCKYANNSLPLYIGTTGQALATFWGSTCLLN